jgi:1,4-alpha-glucan branching enzyme
MSNGYLGFALHAHLPFVRHPEYEHFLEEDWLFEAISETYLPMLRMFNGLLADKVKFKITFSISPTLSAMLTDELLMTRYVRYLKNRIELGEKELERTRDNNQLQKTVNMYLHLFRENLEDFVITYRNNILWGFRNLEKEGVLDIITTASTHAFLPVFEEHPQAIEAQIQSAVISHGRNFGTKPRGFWLPECGYFPGLESCLKANNIDYFFVAAHGILLSEGKPQNGVYSPLELPNGISAFGQDFSLTEAVWSSDTGYPGDPVYREFYRDIGHDLPMEYIKPYIHEPDVRVNTGYKYYAVTGDTDDKILYNSELAMQKIDEHAEDFIQKHIDQAAKLEGLMDKVPFILTAYDAELFGHWWFEGIPWMEAVIRKVAGRENGLEMITAGEYLKKYPKNQVSVPSFSSWGNKYGLMARMTGFTDIFIRLLIV